MEQEVRAQKLQTTYYAVEYFRNQSKEATAMFNLEQVFMVNRFFELKKKAHASEMQIDKMGRRMEQQERTIKILRTILYDALGEVFTCVQKNKKLIEKKCTKFGYDLTGKQNDVFALYQGYLTVIQAINFGTRDREMLDRIRHLEEEIALANSRADAMMWTCQQYLEEEAALRDELLRTKIAYDTLKQESEAEIKRLK